MRPASSSAVAIPLPWSRHGKARAQHLEESELRRRFAALLPRAFPGCRSENDLCERAAIALECSPSTVRNWLRCTNEPPLTTVWKVQFIAGVEMILGGERWL